MAGRASVAADAPSPAGDAKIFVMREKRKERGQERPEWACLLREWRERCGLRVGEVGVPRGTLLNWEAGSRHPLPQSLLPLVVRYHLTAEDVQRLWAALGYAEDPPRTAIRTQPCGTAEVVAADQQAGRAGHAALVHRLEPAVTAARAAESLTACLAVFSSRPADVVDMSCHLQASGDAWGAAHLLAGVIPWIHAETELEWRWHYYAASVQSTLGDLEEAAALLRAAQRHPPTAWHGLRTAMEEVWTRYHQDQGDPAIPRRARALLAWRDPQHGPDPVAQVAGWDLLARVACAPG